MTRIPYEEIRSVNLQYYGMGGYRCVIKTPRIKLAPINRHYLGYNDFEDRNSAYASLMVGLHRKLKVHGRNVTFTSGANWLFYIGLFLNIGLLLAGIGWIWVMVRSEGLNLDSWLILLILPIVWAATFGITRLGRPKDYDPAAPPENMLPQQ